MFWGVTLETGKRYSQVVDSSYHLSMAALEPLSSAVDNQSSKFVSVMIEHNKSEFLLCTLEHNKILQVKLDHCFVEGEEVTYFLTGEGTVHLTGYIMTDGVEGGDDSDDSEENGISMASLKKLRHKSEKQQQEDDDDDSEDDEDWKPELKKQKNWATVVNNVSPKNAVQRTKMEKTKLEKNTEKTSQSLSNKLQKKVPTGKAVLDGQSSDDDEDEDFMMGEEEEEDDDEDEEEEDHDEDEEEEGSAEDSDDNSADESLDEEESPSRPKKKVKLEGVVGKGDMSPAVSLSGKSSSHVSTPSNLSIRQEMGSSKKKNKKQAETSPQAKTPSQRNSNDVSRSAPESTPQQKPRKSIGGVEIQDTIQGHGPVAKNGRMVHVYYRGTLPNKKEFDSCVRGKAFSFRLGRSEVIKGWDVGIEGMKVGGKRKLTIPPSMGYGNRATGSIPPNSTLHFEVELKAVS